MLPGAEIFQFTSKAVFFSQGFLSKSYQFAYSVNQIRSSRDTCHTLFYWQGTYINAGVIEEKTITGQSDILFLPLLVQRIPTSFQQEALPGDTMVISQARVFICFVYPKIKAAGTAYTVRENSKIKTKPKQRKLKTAKEGTNTWQYLKSWSKVRNRDVFRKRLWLEGQEGRHNWRQEK